MGQKENRRGAPTRQDAPPARREGRRIPRGRLESLHFLSSAAETAGYLVFLAGFFAFLAFAGFLAPLLAGDFLPAGMFTSFLSHSR